jgi:hypothetical protein
MKKLRELCRVFPRIEHDINICDTVSESIFTNNSKINPYLYSNEIEKRYGNNEKYIEYKNENFKDFSNYGLNEKNIINHIYYSKNNILFLIGGIGIGKSSFINFFKSKLSEDKNHLCQENCKHHKDGGIIIYIDFNNEIPESFSSDDSTRIHHDIVERINIELRNAIIECSIFSFEEEITNIWNELITSPSTRILKKIRNILIEESGIEIGTNYNYYLDIRKKVYKQITSNVNDFIIYLIEVFRYVTTKHYKTHCSYIILDNLDICSPVVQNIAKDIIVRYFYNSNLKLIVTVRQSTYLGLFDTGFALEAASTIGHKGPDVIKVIEYHLNRAIDNASSLLAGIKHTESAVQYLTDNLKKIKNRILDDNTGTVCMFIKNACGNNIRKALILSRNLISNSVYNPFSIEANITTGTILRALLVGNNSVYTWSYDQEIDNLFHVDNYQDKAYLTKIRILRALSKTNFPDGFELAKLIDLMVGFGYSLGQIRHALNEMMSETKRLIWSNTLQSFKSINEFIQAKTSQLFISTAGLGYQSALFKNSYYFQEVTLDITVDSTEFSGSWDYTHIEDRIELIFKVIRIFVEKDIIEMELFLEKYPFSIYRQYWTEPQLITNELASSISASLLEIINSNIEKEIREKGHAYEKLYHLKRYIQKEFEEIDKITEKQFSDFKNKNCNKHSI